MTDRLSMTSTINWVAYKLDCSESAIYKRLRCTPSTIKPWHVKTAMGMVPDTTKVAAMGKPGGGT